jgi:hypothetical protein
LDLPLFRNKDKEYFETKDRILNEVLIKKGITAQELYSGLACDPQIFEPLAEKIAQEVKAKMEEYERSCGFKQKAGQ